MSVNSNLSQSDASQNQTQDTPPSTSLSSLQSGRPAPVSIDGRWDESARLLVTEQLVRELETIPLSRRTEQSERTNPFVILLRDREQREHLLPHLILDYPLPDEFGNCVLSQLLMPYVPGHKENIAACASLLVRNLQLYGYDFQKVEMATTTRPPPQIAKSEVLSPSLQTDPGTPRPVVPIMTIFLLPFVPSTLAEALISLPTTPRDLLDRKSILTLTSWREQHDLTQALLRKGCDPNSACPQLDKIGTDGRVVRWSRTLVAAIAVEDQFQSRLLHWLLNVAQYGHLENLNLVERSYSSSAGGVIQFEQSALESIQSLADQHPYLSLAQVHIMVIKKIIAWQRYQRQQQENQSHGVTKSEFESRHSTSSSASVSASSSNSLVVIPYMQHRLSDLLHNSADVTDVNFRIDAWLSHAWSRMPELMCLSPPSTTRGPELIDRLPSALAQYPNHLYLGERYTSLTYSQATVFGIYLTLFSPQVDLVSKLEPYVDVLIRQLRLLTPHELLTHPIPASNSPTGVMDYGTPLALIPLPKKENDLMWKVWDVILEKHEEGAQFDPKFKLGFSQKEMEELRINDKRQTESSTSTTNTRTNPTLTDMSVGHHFSIFTRVTYRNPPPSQALLLVQLFQSHGLDYDIFGSIISMYLIYPPYEIPIKLDLLRFWVENGLLDFVTTSRPPVGTGSGSDLTILDQAQLMVKEAEAQLESLSPADSKWGQAFLHLRDRKEILDILMQAQSRT